MKSGKKAISVSRPARPGDMDGRRYMFEYSWERLPEIYKQVSGPIS